MGGIVANAAFGAYTYKALLVRFVNLASSFFCQPRGRDTKKPKTGAQALAWAPVIYGLIVRVALFVMPP